MAAFVAPLRAVNVGDTGRLLMSELQALCQEIGLAGVRPYIGSGNVVFSSGTSEAAISSDASARTCQGLAITPPVMGSGTPVVVG